MHKRPNVVGIKMGSSPRCGNLLEKDHLEGCKGSAPPEVSEEIQCFLWAQAAEVPGGKTQYSRFILTQLSSGVRLRGVIPFVRGGSVKSAQGRKERRPGAFDRSLVDA